MIDEGTAGVRAMREPTVVVVEDSPTQGLNLQAMLGQQDVNVIVAMDGPGGLKMVQQVMPDAVVLDIELPGMDGYEVCRRLKAAPETRHIPVIMLTRHSTDEERASGIESGAVEFIPKDPSAVIVLREVLKQLGVIRGGRA